jgi:hypothetical protein
MDYGIRNYANLPRFKIIAQTVINDIKYQYVEMSQATPKCEYNDCRNVGVTTSQCTECEKYFCDEHREAHIAEH